MEADCRDVRTNRVKLIDRSIEHKRNQHHGTIMQPPDRVLHPNAGEILQEQERLRVQIMIDVRELLFVIAQKSDRQRWNKTDKSEHSEQPGSQAYSLIVFD
jgi:hypothetical protein